MQYVIEKFFRKTGIIADSSQRNVVSRVIGIGCNGVLAFTLLGTLGIDTSPLLTAAGVTGATIGFASRDFGANIVAGLALVGQPCFRTGKVVSIGTGQNKVGGTIDHWDVRYLYLRGSHGELIQVPNNLILTSVVTLENPNKSDFELEWSADGVGTPKQQPDQQPDEDAEALSELDPPTLAGSEKKLWDDAAKKAETIKSEKS